MSNISLTTLGGVRENGKNMYIAEIDGSIFVLDAGLKYPENEQLGVLDPRACGCHWCSALSFGRG